MKLDLIRLIRPSSAEPARAEAAAAASEADDRPRGCGWFDSSHELSHGLSVTEHASADAVAGEMPLLHWLQLHLGEVPHFIAAADRSAGAAGNSSQGPRATLRG